MTALRQLEVQEVVQEEKDGCVTPEEQRGLGDDQPANTMPVERLRGHTTKPSPGGATVRRLGIVSVLIRAATHDIEAPRWTDRAVSASLAMTSPSALGRRYPGLPGQTNASASLGE
jgi:hypothetical protein